jgi:hypothetical protein
MIPPYGKRPRARRGAGRLLKSRFVWNFTDGKKQQHCRAGAPSCRSVWNLTSGKKGKPPARVSLLHFVQFTLRSLCNKLQKLLATSPALLGAKRGVSLSAESDQRRRLWNPPPFEKGGPKLYYLVRNLTGGENNTPRGRAFCRRQNKNGSCGVASPEKNHFSIFHFCCKMVAGPPFSVTA